MSRRISPDALNEGEHVVLKWSPYDWAREETGLKSQVRVEVVEKSGIPGMMDIVLETAGGTRLRHTVDNGYILGPSGGRPGVPDRTDIGRFRRYEAV